MNRLVLCLILITGFSAFGEAGLSGDCNCTINGFSKDMVRAAGKISAFVAQPGFHSLESDVCAPQAELAKKSVLRMMLPAKPMSLRKLMGKDSPEFRKQIVAAMRKAGDQAPTTNDMNIAEIEKCLTENSEDCVISTAYRSSTIVLTGDGTAAATALHNLTGFWADDLKLAKKMGLSAERVAADLSGVNVPAYFYNSEGKLIARPDDLAMTTTITREQIEMSWREIETNRSETALDKIKIKFSKKMGPGIPIAKDPPQEGDILRIYGFAGKTKDGEYGGGPTSDGKALTCTIGPTLSLSGYADRVGADASTLSPKARENFVKNVVHTASSSMHGMSGGAVLNSKGELVAIHSSGSAPDGVQTTANSRVFENP